ncbi:hypothetical protein M5K25_000299 [Dendrobium thyrsiflorum]|uniref:HMA domain-containing protein n=1 Tax=Dendrobium thyrsiflorum TaxID=117978 RepID=A0ABD0VV37_DENTH
MGGTSKQALRFAENLSLPKVQVIVMKANMSCNHCRKRVSGVISRMNSILDYIVDCKKNEVTIKGIVHDKRNKRIPGSMLLVKMLCLGPP